MIRIRKTHNKHVIEATSIQSVGTRFTVHFDIETHKGGHINVTHFESDQLFKSDTEALEAGLRMGQQKIDAGYDPSTPNVA